MQDSDYESVRELAVHCKKEGINLADLTSALRIRNYIKELRTEEERVEQFIARCANSQDPQKLVDALEKIGNIGQKGRIDILFANAGILESAPLGSITEAHFDKIFNINVKGLLFTVQGALPLFQDGGSVILTSSVGGSKGTPALSVYNATKAAIRSFARYWTVCS
ncbi:MAG: SDR family NAD(P)-dependent oxidoreductase [Candidatus Nitrosopolaris sp.]